MNAKRRLTTLGEYLEHSEAAPLSKDSLKGRLPSGKAMVSSLVLHVVCVGGLWALPSYWAESQSELTDERPIKPQHFVLIYTRPRPVRKVPLSVQEESRTAVARAEWQKLRVGLPKVPATRAPDLAAPQIEAASPAPGLGVVPAPVTLVQRPLVPAGFDLQPNASSTGIDRHSLHPIAVAGFADANTGGAVSRKWAGIRMGGFDVPGGGIALPPPPKPPRLDSSTEPLEIIERPRPSYTQEARARKIEGVVRVRACFRSDGTVQVLEILNSLGYGLDERAIAAVQRIRFKPGKRNGEALPEQTAVIEVDFRLAG